MKALSMLSFKTFVHLHIGISTLTIYFSINGKSILVGNCGEK
jgi:hypothetical protein